MPDLEPGRAHFERGEWREAHEALTAADAAEPLGAEDLERLALAAALMGRDDEFLAAHERAYQQWADAEQFARAARAAFWVGFRLFALGEPGRAGGWITRAQRMVERAGEDCVERGYLMLPTLARHLFAGDNEAAAAVAEDVIAIGERFDEADLLALARTFGGRALLRQGELDRGMSLLDEAMVAATAGELQPVVTGMVYCTVIATCQQVYALERAREWTAALSRWCDDQPQLVTFTGSCLVHRAEIMQLGGDWPEAIEEVQRASDRVSQGSDPEVLGAACYQRAEIYRLRGDYDDAEQAYRRASESGHEPQPGLALLRLAQGKRDAAVSAIRRVLDTTTATWQRARLLPAFIEIHLAAGELDAARDASRELDRIANEFPIEILGALAAHARGAVALAEGDAQAADGPLRQAFHTWQKIGAPYIAARIRVLCGRACEALGDTDGAQLERDAARRVFAELGAAPDLAALDGAAPTGAGGSHGLSPRELEVLRLVAAGKTNKAIASELCVSERTIDRHVSNIFTKLDVSSRSAATAFAYEHDLVG